jgi:hypothetical protein
MPAGHLHCQGTVIVNSRPKPFPTHPSWSQFGGTLTQYMYDPSHQTDPRHGTLPFYHSPNYQSFHLNFALNPTQKNFQKFVDHLQVNTVFEIIFSYEFESDNEEGVFLLC